MKIEMSYEIKSTKQPAPQPVNYTNQLRKKHCVTSKTTDLWNNLPSKHLQAKQPEVEPTLYTNLPNDK